MNYGRSILRTRVQDADIEHLFLKQTTPSDKLLILIPGRGYTTEHPVLYYVRRMAVDLGYDVLSIVFSFQIQRGEFGSQNITQEVELAVNQALKDGAYKEVVFCGKSLGTPLALAHAQQILNHQVRLIMLTPISNVVASVGEISTLAIIGTADQAYSAAHVAADKDKSNVQWKVYENLNHGLEDPSDWRRSVEVLSSITADCEAFLRGS